MVGVGLRLTFTLQSLIVDKILVSLVGAQRRVARGMLLLWSTSYVGLAYFTHPLIETSLAILVGVSIIVLFSAHWTPQRSTESYQWYSIRTAACWVLYGALFGLGASAGPRFSFFGLPLAILGLLKSFGGCYRGILNQNSFERKVTCLALWVSKELLPWLAAAWATMTLCRQYMPQEVCNSSEQTRVSLVRNSLGLAHTLWIATYMFLPLLGGGHDFIVWCKTKKKVRFVVMFIALSLAGLFFSDPQDRTLLPLTVPAFYLSVPVLKAKLLSPTMGLVVLHSSIGVFYALSFNLGVRPAFINVKLKLNHFNGCVVAKTSSHVECQPDEDKVKPFYVSPCDRFYTHILTYNTHPFPSHLLHMPDFQQKKQQDHHVVFTDIPKSNQAHLIQALHTLGVPFVPSNAPPNKVLWRLSEDEELRTRCSRVILISPDPQAAELISASPKYPLPDPMKRVCHAHHMFEKDCRFDALQFSLLPYHSLKPRFAFTTWPRIQHYFAHFNLVLHVKNVVQVLPDP
ncbi:hypothetical protein DSO57_1014571 [Entomophthora muscae]|uniref:Uncharacterized protein n=1 Tax=Entomophthora muscae TaxID=34485 RepID=A0ACC2SUK6_9FUNG|nr:hypothetical protein DSO57_1014571 [Entomophthora muscae]